MQNKRINLVYEAPCVQIVSFKAEQHVLTVSGEAQLSNMQEDFDNWDNNNNNN